MSFAFFARNSLKIVHVSGANGCSNDCQMIYLRRFFTGLVIFEKELQVLHILKFDKFQGYERAIQLLWC